MNEKNKVFFVPDGNAIYAVPEEICKKYAVKGDDLEAVKKGISEAAAAAQEEESDVEGQQYYPPACVVQGYSGYREPNACGPKSWSRFDAYKPIRLLPGNR